jgi:hypothetical protein
MRVSRDVEALDLELKGWEKAQTNKGTKGTPTTMSLSCRPPTHNLSLLMW